MSYIFLTQRGPSSWTAPETNLEVYTKGDYSATLETSRQGQKAKDGEETDAFASPNERSPPLHSVKDKFSLLNRRFQEQVPNGGGKAVSSIKILLGWDLLSEFMGRDGIE